MNASISNTPDMHDSYQQPMTDQRQHDHRYRTISVAPQELIATHEQPTALSKSHGYWVAALLVSSLTSVLVGYVLGNTHRYTHMHGADHVSQRFATSSNTLADSQAIYVAGASQADQPDAHPYQDGELISAADFRTSTIGPRDYNSTTHITGTIDAVFTAYMPDTPALFPVLRLAPTVNKKCTSQLPVVQAMSDEQDGVNAVEQMSLPDNAALISHDDRWIEQEAVRRYHLQQQTTDDLQAASSSRQLLAVGTDRSIHSDTDVIANTEYDVSIVAAMNLHEHNRHHRHGHQKRKHHHRHHNDDWRDVPMIRSDRDDPHADHHHAQRNNDPDHHHNKYIFDDDPIDKSPPAPTTRFHWCYNCTNRCKNVVSAIKYMAKDNSPRDQDLKFTEMAESLPRFFRGVDHLYLEDVFNLPYDSKFFRYSHRRTRTFVSADQHLYNYGTFDNSRNEITYDMNDFDQTLIDNYHIDLWRTATSLVIHMRINYIPLSEQNRILYDFASTYYTTVASFVGNDNELFAYLHKNNTEGATYETTYLAETANTRKAMLDKLSYIDSDGVRRLDDSGKKKSLEPASHQVYDRILHYWPNYLESLGTIHRNNSNALYISQRNHTLSWRGAWQHTDDHHVSHHCTDCTHKHGGVEDMELRKRYFTIKSVAKRVGAGLGSLGVPRYYVLVEGPTDSQNDDIVLDVKYEPVPEWWNVSMEYVMNV